MKLRTILMASVLVGIGGTGVLAQSDSGFGTDESAKPAKGAKAAEPAEATGMPKMEATIPDEKQLLEAALTNMSRLRGFHVEAVIETPAGKASLSGDLGDGTMWIRGTDPKGNHKLRVVAGGQFYLSTDDGKTWKTGDAAEKEFSILFSTILTAPINPSLEPWKKGEFKSTEVTVDGEDLLHLEKPAQGKDAAADYWLCVEPEMAKALEPSPPVFLRKVNIIVAADDGDFPISVSYTNLTKPVDIKAPVIP